MGECRILLQRHEVRGPATFDQSLPSNAATSHGSVFQILRIKAKMG